MELEAEKWRLCSTTLVRGVAGELEDCFLEAGIVSISLPPDFNWVGPAACERCQQLQIVDLSWTDIPEILGSTFAHCPQLQQLRLSRNLRRIEQEAFLRCASLCEVCIPPSLLHIARRALVARSFAHSAKLGKARLGRGRTPVSMLLTNVST